MRTSTALFAWLALASASPTQAQDPGLPARTPIQAGLANLIPSGTFFLVTGSSLDALQAALNEALPEFAPGMDVPNIQGELPIDGSLIATDKPLALAANFHNGQPVMTLIFPATDPQAAIEAVVALDDSGSQRTAGGYVGMCQGENYEVGDGSFLSGMQSGLISMRLDFAPVLETYGPIINMMSEQARVAASQELEDFPSPIDMEAAMDLYFDGFELAMESLEVLDLGFDMRNEHLTVLTSLSLAEGSPLAGFGSDTPSDFGKLAKHLGGTNNMGSFLMGLDYGEYKETLTPFIDQVMQAYTEDVRKELQPLFTKSMELLQNGGPNIGGQFRLNEGMQFNYCLLYTSPSPRDRTRSRMPSSA